LVVYSMWNVKRLKKEVKNNQLKIHLSSMSCYLT